MSELYVSATTDKEKSALIRLAIGWTYEPRFEGDTDGYYVTPSGRKKVISEELPNYFESLKAMHYAEMYFLSTLERRNALWYPYCKRLHADCGGLGEHASARVRAEAFGQVMKLW